MSRYLPCKNPCQSPSCHICEFATKVNEFENSKELIEMFDKLTEEELQSLFKEIDKKLIQRGIK